MRRPFLFSVYGHVWLHVQHRTCLQWIMGLFRGGNGLKLSTSTGQQDTVCQDSV